MSQDEAVNRWLESAEKNIQMMDDMFGLKHYDWALFFGQLALEKMLKALVVQNTDQPPPYIHNLEKLAQIANITFSESDKPFLSEITTFHVAARYDDIKLVLYGKATPEFTEKYIRKIKEIFLWLKPQIKTQ